MERSDHRSVSEAAGLVVFSGREVNAGAEPTDFLLSLGPQPMKWYPPQLGSFPSRLIIVILNS